ncbi:MAG TPA: hypothetical protein VKB51_14135 [bacterium]|nr:hypothetical protein [bacterium]
MIHVLRAIALLLVSAAIAAVMLAVLSAMPPTARAPGVALRTVVHVPPEVRYLRALVARVNPSLPIEDPECALVLPGAIYRSTHMHGLDWQRLATLAWQESDFDCHAKNRVDRGGAYGPFQIRQLWSSVIGDPRPLYFEPELAVERVVQVVRYYQETGRYQHLIGRGFRNPLLCLYNTGETLRVNMVYCRQVGAKLRQLQEGWREFQAHERQQAIAAGAQPPAG